MELTVHIDKAIGDSAIAKIYKPGCEMVMVVPQFIIIRAQGLNKEMQKKILLALAKDRETLAERAAEHGYEIDIEV